MAVMTYTKAGSKAATPAKLDKAIFGLEVKNYQLLKDAYLAYLAGGRTNNAVAKKRGEVRGGGKKPWRQKGTGNARVGSSRNPIWRGGGVAFGPTGEENYARKLNTKAKRQALKQALSIAANENRVAVIDSFIVTDGKTASASKLLHKLKITTSGLIVTENKDNKTVLALRNISHLKLIAAKNLNAYDVLNAESILFEKNALAMLSDSLGVSK